MSHRDTNKNCASEGELIAYLYNEMPLASRTQFESHFADCSLCIDAFAEVADSRFSVYEWQRLEFAPLETPVIQIPYGSAVRSSSWISSLKEAFSTRPQFAFASAFGAVFMIVALGYFMPINDSPTNDIATVPLAEEPRSAIVSPADINVNADSESAKGTEIDVDSERETTVSLVEDESRPQSVRQPSSSRSIRETRPRQRFQPQPTERISTVNATQTAPRLNEFDDVADDSLRLADLFDDIETSE